MKNSDMPSMPVIKVTEESMYNGAKYTEVKEGFMGLTKREYFTGLAMQSILSNRDYESPRRNKFTGMATDAVAAAGALLKALEDE